MWDALTQPRHLLRWWGPDYCPLVACDVDFRVGGDWRYVARDMDGNELGWHGTYREIEPTQRIVSTEVFEGFPDAESVNTMTLTEHDGVTTLRTLVLHQTTRVPRRPRRLGDGGRHAARVQPARRPARHGLDDCGTLPPCRRSLHRPGQRGAGRRLGEPGAVRRMDGP